MRILISATGVVLLGCVKAPVRVPFEASAPQEIPAGVLGKIESDGVTTLFLEDLDLRISAGDRRSYGVRSRWEFSLLIYPLPMIIPSRTREAEPAGESDLLPHVILLEFRPREEGFGFHPDSVRVVPDDGLARSIEAFIGPADPSCSGDWSAPESSRHYALPPGEPSCFVLRFPTQGTPEVAFRPYVSGITRLGEPTPPMELRFGKFTGNTLD